jgi:Ca2+-binding EF-hand superfamily protein
MEFLDRGAPTVELVVRLGMRAAQHNVVELVERPRGDGEAQPRQAPSKSESAKAERRNDALVTIDATDVVVDFRTEDVVWDISQARENCDRLFDELDFDDNKSLSTGEARGQQPFQGLFRLMDRNGDAQVGKDEMNAVLTLLENLWRGHAVLGVKDRGTRLFANLDTSGDGRLSPRELRAASDRLASFDRNGDGKVTMSEIPHKFELAISQAPPPPGLAMRGKAAAAADPSEPGSAGPRWFQMMDRNHDGDVSPREFLGPTAEFRRLDADGDGLIDAREAAGGGSGR